MTREELIERINKVQEKIDKCNARLDYYRGFTEEGFIAKEVKDIISGYKYVDSKPPFKAKDITTLDQVYSIYLDLMKLQTEVNSKRWGYEPKEQKYEDAVRSVDYDRENYFGDSKQGIKDKERELQDLTATLNKYQVALEKINNFENSEKIKPIWDFLCNWEEKCYEWYLHNAETYFNLKKDFETEFREAESVWLQSNPKPDKDVDYHAYRMWQRQYEYMKHDFTERYYSQIDSFTKNITSIKMRSEGDWMNRRYIPESYTVDIETLKKELAKEKVTKYNDLVNRVTSVVGNIVDASDLSIGNQHGEINGIVVGDRSRAKVETISAGGYNIQRFHYRILIHEVK